MAGAVTVLASAAPDATPDELVDAIKSTGVPITDWRNGIVTPRVQVDLAADLLTAGDPDRIVLAIEPFASGFDQPVGIANAGDGSNRLFVLERTGRIRIHDGAGVVSTPFLDLSAQVWQMTMAEPW